MQEMGLCIAGMSQWSDHDWEKLAMQPTETESLQPDYRKNMILSVCDYDAILQSGSLIADVMLNTSVICAEVLERERFPAA